MLRLEIARRPAASGLELDAQEVADLAVHAIAHFAEQLAFGIADANVGLQGNGLVELETSAGQRNILEIGDTFSDASRFIFPVHVNHVGAQHSRFNTPIEHILLIGLAGGSHYARNRVKITYPGLNQSTIERRWLYVLTVTPSRGCGGRLFGGWQAASVSGIDDSHGAAGSGSGGGSSDFWGTASLVQRHDDAAAFGGRGVCPDGAIVRGPGGVGILVGNRGSGFVRLGDREAVGDRRVRLRNRDRDADRLPGHLERGVSEPAAADSSRA